VPGTLVTGTAIADEIDYERPDLIGLQASLASRGLD
jgi:hypothetical protein